MEIKTTIKDGKITITGLEKYNDKEVMIKIRKFDMTRSEKQNRSLHLFFTLLAKEMNLHGIDFRKFIRKEVL